MIITRGHLYQVCLLSIYRYLPLINVWIKFIPNGTRQTNCFIVHTYTGELPKCSLGRGSDKCLGTARVLLSNLNGQLMCVDCCPAKWTTCAGTEQWSTRQIKYLRCQFLKKTPLMCHVTGSSFVLNLFPGSTVSDNRHRDVGIDL